MSIRIILTLRCLSKENLCLTLPAKVTNENRKRLLPNFNMDTTLRAIRLSADHLYGCMLLESRANTTSPMALGHTAWWGGVVSGRGGDLGDGRVEGVWLRGGPIVRLNVTGVQGEHWPCGILRSGGSVVSGRG